MGGGLTSNLSTYRRRFHAFFIVFHICIAAESGTREHNSTCSKFSNVVGDKQMVLRFVYIFAQNPKSKSKSFRRHF